MRKLILSLFIVLTSAMGLEHATSSIEHTVIASGYANVKGHVNRQNSIVMPGAYASSVAYINEYELPFFVQHDYSLETEIGNIIGAIEDSRGLYILVKIDDPFFQQKVVKGELKYMSIGFRGTFVQEHPDAPKKIIDMDLLEVSLVTIPADKYSMFDKIIHRQEYRNGYVLQFLEYMGVI